MLTGNELIVVSERLKLAPCGVLQTYAVVAGRAGGKEKKQLYHCNMCNHTTKSSTGMYYHKNQHRGVYPYYCPYCQKGHCATANLKSHLKNQHNILPSPLLFHCLYCRKGITDKLVDYVRHVNSCVSAPPKPPPQQRVQEGGAVERSSPSFNAAQATSKQVEDTNT